MKYILSLERQANHPIAEALCKHCIKYEKNKKNKKVALYDKVLEFENIPGEGVKGIVNGKKVEIGNRRLAERVCGGKHVDVMAHIPKDWTHRGGTIGWVLVNGIVVSTFILSDTVRPTAAEAMLDLKQKEFVDYALKTFGTNELTTAQLKEANAHFGCKYAPQWLIKNTDYKVGKSLFKLPTENEDQVS